MVNCDAALSLRKVFRSSFEITKDLPPGRGSYHYLYVTYTATTKRKASHEDSPYDTKDSIVRHSNNVYQSLRRKHRDRDRPL